MKFSIELLRKYWKQILLGQLIVGLIVLGWIWIRSEQKPLVGEAKIELKGEVVDLIEINSRRILVRLDLSEGNISEYDVRDSEKSWCCVVKGEQAEIIWYPFDIQIGDSLEYGPENLVKVFRDGKKVDEDKIGLSPLGGVFEIIRKKHQL